MDKKSELEYRTLNENLRWWSNVRFAQLTLFFLIAAAIFRTVNDTATGLTDIELLALKIGGAAISLVFGYLEFRANEYWTHFQSRARQLEAKFKINQFRGVKSRRPRTSTLLIILFASSCLYWVLEILAPFWWPGLV